MLLGPPLPNSDLAHRAWERRAQVNRCERFALLLRKGLEVVIKPLCSMASLAGLES